MNEAAINEAAVQFAPLLPAALLAALALAATLATAAGLYRRAAGTLWRACAFAAALLFLFNPIRHILTGTPLPRIALIAVDRSASMQVGNRATLASAAAARLIRDAARQNLDLRRVDVTDTTSGTDLFAALASAEATIPPAQRAGTIAITDGVVAPVPRRIDGPLHVLIPATHEETDRRLRLLRAPLYGIVGQSVDLAFQVDDLGTANTGTAPVTWRIDGAEGGHAEVPLGQPATITIPITRAGRITVALDAATRAGEATSIDNRAAVSIDGIRDRLKVLLISGEPNEDERTWRRLLKSDPSVDLVHFTILRPPGKDDFTPLNQLALIAFPIRELFVEKIRQFDLIILDRFSETGLLPPSYVDNIADYVRDGGALLVCAGPEFADPAGISGSAIGDVLPAAPAQSGAVVEGPFLPTVTRLGRLHPVTADLPGDDDAGAPHWGRWYRYLAVGPTQGSVVMSAGANGPPLLILNRVDKGRVALLLSDQIWLWARGHEGGGPQEEFLRRVAHWLMKQPDLDENALTARIEDGRLTIARRALTPLPQGTMAAITAPDGTTQHVTLTNDAAGEATATLPATLPGAWKVSVAGQTAYAAATPADPAEFNDLRATADYLRPVATSIHWLGRGLPNLSDLPLAQPHALRLSGQRDEPLFPPLAALPLVLLLVAAAWRKEGT